MELDDPPCGSPASPWQVKTYGGKGAGSMNLVRATLASDNSVYAQLTSDLGPDKVKETARMMGIKSKLNGYCAESLGGLEDGVSPLEMASAYATIANGGYRNRPRMIEKVVGPDGKKIKLPPRWRVHRVKAFSDGVTYEATKILEQNVQGGTGTHANIGCPAGGKTGTTDKNIDAWFVGFTPRLSTAVWVGFPGSTSTSMNGMYAPTGGNIDGGTYPADIWGQYMKQAVGKYCGEFKKPTDPFQSQPFKGHYASEGGKDDSKDADKDNRPQRPRRRSWHADRSGRRLPGRQAGQARRPQRRGRRSQRLRDPSADKSRAGPPAAGRKLPATAETRLAAAAPDWYNLRRQGRVRAVMVVCGKAVPAAPLAHAGSKRSAVRCLLVS